VKPKVFELQNLEGIKWVYEATFTDGSTGIIEVDPTIRRPIINNTLCTVCRTGTEMCLYLSSGQPLDCCPVIHKTED
jgi:hypothetical protein